MDKISRSRKSLQEEFKLYFAWVIITWEGLDHSGRSSGISREG